VISDGFSRKDGRCSKFFAHHFFGNALNLSDFFVNLIFNGI